MTINIKKEETLKLFYQSRFVKTMKSHTRLPSKQIYEYAKLIDAGEEVKIHLDFSEEDGLDFLVELLELNLGIAIEREEDLTVDDLDIEKLKLKYFEDGINNYCLDSYNLIVHKPTGSVMIIENNREAEFVNGYLERCKE